jgi:hypothetical protein
MLSEAVSALPHPPVPSLLQSSVLVQMLAVSSFIPRVLLFIAVLNPLYIEFRTNGRGRQIS